MVMEKSTSVVMEEVRCISVIPRDVFIGNIETLTSGIEFLEKGIIIKTVSPSHPGVVLKWSSDIRRIKCVSVFEPMDIPVSGHYIFLESNNKRLDGFTPPLDDTLVFDPDSSDPSLKYIVIKLDPSSTDFLTIYLLMTNKCSHVMTITPMEAVSRFLTVSAHYLKRNKHKLLPLFDNQQPLCHSADLHDQEQSQLTHQSPDQSTNDPEEEPSQPLYQPLVVKSEPTDEVSSTNTIGEPSSLDSDVSAQGVDDRGVDDQGVDDRDFSAQSVGNQCDDSSGTEIYEQANVISPVQSDTNVLPSCDGASDRANVDQPIFRPRTRPSNMKKTFYESSDSSDSDLDRYYKRRRKDRRRRPYLVPLVDLIRRANGVTDPSETFSTQRPRKRMDPSGDGEGVKVSVNQEGESSHSCPSASGVVKSVVNISQSDESSEEEPLSDLDSVSSSLLDLAQSGMIQRVENNVVYFGSVKCRYREISFYQNRMDMFINEVEKMDLDEMVRSIQSNEIDSIAVCNDPPVWLVRTIRLVSTVTANRLQAMNSSIELRGDLQSILVMLNYPMEAPWPRKAKSLSSSLAKEMLMEKRLRSRIHLQVQSIHFSWVKAKPLLLTLDSMDGFTFKSRFGSRKFSIKMKDIISIEYSVKPASFLLRLSEDARREVMNHQELIGFTKYESATHFSLVTIKLPLMWNNKWARILKIFQSERNLVVEKLPST